MKKLLIGIHLGAHDLNISLYDGINFKYLHDERDSTIKQSSLINFDSRLKYLSYFLKKNNYSISNIQSICCTVGPRDDFTSFVKNEKDLWQSKDFFNGIECYQIDHHYAHGLSSFPIIKTDNHYINDGHGDWHKYLSIIKEDKIVDYLKEGEHGDSFGYLLEELTEQFKLGDWKTVGKIMALVGYGKIDKLYINKYKSFSLENNQQYSHIRNFIRFCYDKGIFNNLYSFENCSDYISTLHKLYEEKFINYLKKHFNEDTHFSYSGGIAQSIVLNTEYKKVFKNIVTLPHANDCGLSLGCIEWLRQKKNYDPIKLDNFPFIQSDEHPGQVSLETIKKTAEHLAKNKIVLWYQGHGEIGPRALGNRSILMNPLFNKEILNAKVKKREWYRPYGASVTEEDYKTYFNLNWKSPYMLYNAKTIDSGKFKSITHVDGTCRIQTVSNKQEHYYTLLKEFEKLTGFPILLNTSFNIQGKAIVGSLKDAKTMFDESEADILVLGNTIYERKLLDK